MKKILLTVALSGILTCFTATSGSVPYGGYYPNDGRVHQTVFYGVAMDTWERRHPWGTGYQNIRTMTGHKGSDVLKTLEWSATVCHNQPYVIISDTMHLRFESFQNGTPIGINQTETITLTKTELPWGKWCGTISGNVSYQGLNLKFEDIPQFTLHAWADVGHSRSVNIQRFSYKVAY